MGIYIQGGKKVGGMYMADGRGNATKIGGMYYADGKGNATKIYSSYLPVGTVLYEIPNKYTSVFLSGNSKVPSYGSSFAILTKTVLLKYPIKKCKNGVKVTLSKQILTYDTYQASYRAIFTPANAVNPTTLLLNKQNPSANLEFGISEFANDGFGKSTVSVLDNELSVTTNGHDYSGANWATTGGFNTFSFFLITSIVAF